MTSVPAARPPEGSHGEQHRAAPDPEGTAGAGPAADAESTGGGESAGRTSGAARRALALALLAGALGAALALVAAGQVWSDATASFAQGHVPVRAKGSEVTSLPSALALVGLAALVAVFAVRRTARHLVASLLALCGVGTAVSALSAVGDTAALSAKAAKVSGLAHTGVDAVRVGAWPYLSAVGGVLLLLAGALALWYGRDWPSMSGSGRYERASASPGAVRRPGAGAPRTAPVDPDRPEELWKALDRGEDPTGDTA